MGKRFGADLMYKASIDSRIDLRPQTSLRRSNVSIAIIHPEASRESALDRLIGESHSMISLKNLIVRSGRTALPILIQGESGTGKELVARAIHEGSSRCSCLMVTINCAAIPHALLESELFGHEKGSFTGAHETKQGLFELAHGGTLFLDEIGELPLDLQAKLLRVLDDGMIRRIGATSERFVDVRIIAATNRKLATEVEERRFREDLYYRVNVLEIEVPPLRQRDSDIALLANKFAGSNWSINLDAMEFMSSFSWPGNVRQLINTIERSKILCDDHAISMQYMPSKLMIGSTQHDCFIARAPENATLQAVTKNHIENTVLNHATISESAALLGIDKRTLYRMMRKFGINSSRSLHKAMEASQ